MNSPLAFTMEKALVNIIFGHKIYICQMTGAFYDFWDESDDKVTFCSRCFRTR